VTFEFIFVVPDFSFQRTGFPSREFCNINLKVDHTSGEMEVLQPLNLTMCTSEAVKNARSISSTCTNPWNNNTEPVRPDKKRFRQHVNPLSQKFQMPTILSPSWPESYLDPTLPLFLDIGCGKGTFLLEMASQFPDKNYLGLEIRPPVARLAQTRVVKWGLSERLKFIGCNANVDLNRILKDYVSYGGSLCNVSIQFPDPHFKKRNFKKRVVKDDLVKTLMHFSEKGVELFLQSDVKEVLDDMRCIFRDVGKGYFEDDIHNLEEYLNDNPLGVRTEREISVQDKGLPVYRTLLRRK